jgi:hypothetical protein
MVVTIPRHYRPLFYDRTQWGKRLFSSTEPSAQTESDMDCTEQEKREQIDEKATSYVSSRGGGCASTRFYELEF